LRSRAFSRGAFVQYLASLSLGATEKQIRSFTMSLDRPLQDKVIMKRKLPVLARTPAGGRGRSVREHEVNSSPKTAFHAAIFKLTAYCNLNCSYCYMFNLADRTFERVPRRMDTDVAIGALRQVQEHAELHRLQKFDITLHGGEPALWGMDRYVKFLDEVSVLRSRGLDLRVSVQTNGLTLDLAWLRLLSAHDVTVGLSLDGPRDVHDKHRVNHAGRGSYDTIVSGLSRAFDAGLGNVFSGILSVAQPEIGPARFLDWADSLPLRSMDVLWPIQFNWDHPPWGDGAPAEYAEKPTYGGWFSELFSEWWNRDDPTLYVRHFYDCVMAILRGRAGAMVNVNQEPALFAVNTNGGLEYHDFMRPHRDGGAHTGLNILVDSLDALLADPVVSYCLDLAGHLPSDCVGCGHVNLCGGGYLPGRMTAVDHVPNRRSVLCWDHYEFLSTVRSVVEGATVATGECPTRILRR
jgi:uncharacterized protein